MRISRLAPGDEAVVLAGRELFDKPPTAEWAAGFLAREGHHLLFALSDDGEPIGFVSGVETMHPDKGTEMFLYELDVAEAHRGLGRRPGAGRGARRPGAGAGLLRHVGRDRC